MILWQIWDEGKGAAGVYKEWTEITGMVFVALGVQYDCKDINIE